MKNLELWDISSRRLHTDASDPVRVICYGYDEHSSLGNLFVCTHNLIVSKYNENGETVWSKDLTQHASPDNSPINVTYLSLNNTVCVGLSNGELYTINDIDCSSELAGVCDNGLLALDWSPDQESLVLVTKDFKSILMSCMFDPIKETNLLLEEFGEKQFITVGWGKKETQFHGKEGKQAATLKNEVTAEVNTSAKDKIRITWRGDGNLYAVGYSVLGVRQFKVFDKDGNLQFTSEKHQGIEANLSWRPSGNVITTTQLLPDGYYITFFEKNGLKHGGFTIPVKTETKVEEILWNSDSEVLGLQCRNEDDSQNVLVFTTGNYHWYLKQVLTFKKDQKICKILWDNSFEVSSAKKLHVILDNGQHFSYTWIWNINHSYGKDLRDDAIVAVIDGSNVLLTGFRQTIVPPPLSALKINLNSCIESIHFAPPFEADPNTILICTEDKIAFYEQTQKFPLQYKELKTLNKPTIDFPFQWYIWLWLDKKTLVSAKIEEDGTHYLVEYNISSEALIQKQIINLPDAVLRMQPHPKNNKILFLQLKSGDILQYSIDEGIDPLEISFITPCHKFDVISIGQETYFLGLTHNGHFYINNSVSMSDVSSYFIHTHFLLLTTLRHLLICVELNVSGINSLIEYQKVKSVNVNERKIERGAKLVIAVPSDTRTILQMPRGNLESIQPRSPSLKIIGELLNNLKYYEAFDFMRKQRINLNLIYDHDPEKFTQNVEVFLERIDNNSWLNLFLSDLENVDVTKTMYSSSYSERKLNNNTDKDKVVHVCNIIRDNLNKRSDRDSKMLPLLTTYVKKNTVEEMEKALLIIKELKLRETKSEKLPVTSDEALKYLLYMVDVINLFNIALGMYDFDLVLLIANKSQKDPKEYIQMLNDWNDMEENYRKFSINKYLKRYDKAVQSLVMCGPSKHEELRTFVKYHSLYRDALAYLSPSDEVYKQIGDDFGLNLKLKKQFTEAGIIYERANNIDKAIECFKLALEWELALKLAVTHWTKYSLQDLCRELVSNLKEEKRHREALIILEQYNTNSEDTLKYAVESGLYRSALRLSSQKEQILPAMLEDYQIMKKQIEVNLTTFKRHKERLCVVRETKKENPTEFYDPSFANKDSDLYSDAGSTVASSRGSSRSFRSSKNRRKHERKVASLKEGSQYEDVALIMALHSLITSTYELRTPVKELNIALSSCDRDQEAITLQVLLDRALREMKESFGLIWTNELLIEATKASMAAMNLPDGCNIIPQGLASLEPHIRIPPVIHEINWKLDGLTLS